MIKTSKHDVGTKVLTFADKKKLYFLTVRCLGAVVDDAPRFLPELR